MKAKGERGARGEVRPLGQVPHTTTNTRNREGRIENTKHMPPFHDNPSPQIPGQFTHKKSGETMRISVAGQFRTARSRFL